MDIIRTVLDGELGMIKKAVEEFPDDLSGVGTRLRSMGVGGTDKGKADKVTVKLLVGGDNIKTVQGWLTARKGDVVSADGRVIVANIKKTQVAELDRCPHLARAEAARIMLPRMDEACHDTGLEGWLSAVPERDLTGKGVSLGIVDSGVDYTHPDFIDAGNKTRLDLFVHAAQTGSISSYNEFDSAAINQALKQNSSSLPQGDPHGHGTHCASIAAGNGKASGGRFKGVAPATRLIAVRSEPLLDTHTIWGIRKTFELAGKAKQPAVVSLSLGGHIGAHDGTSTIENVIAQESGPGRIVVVAAGNEGQDNIHWQGLLSVDDPTEMDFRVADSELQAIDVWVPRGDEVAILIQTPDGAQFKPDGNIHQTVFGQFRADWREDPVNKDRNLTLLIAGGLPNFTWKILMEAEQVSQGLVHAWAYTRSSSNTSHIFVNQSNNGYSIGMPATEERAISVGSYVSKNYIEKADGTQHSHGLKVGAVSPFSSRGPTRIGMQKPDILGPGQFITAALAKDSAMAVKQSYVPRHHPADGYVTIQGTSMATPFVAGVIALMLEREPDLNPEVIQQRMRITAKRNAKTGRVWNDAYGFGVIDVEALLDYQG